MATTDNYKLTVAEADALRGAAVYKAEKLSEVVHNEFLDAPLRSQAKGQYDMLKAAIEKLRGNDDEASEGT